ncbi:flagellar hook-basal body complex protein [Ruminococcaceae bacterium OttesenSCG-928-I18]|nr:flagellar hook-basal body complex protein [Ruminococcaceae bacterium OttesenSCG-928-I18]
MVRSMYSGVSGLRTHQTRMDTIGNNIANVNTYGFKSARTTFRDIYYQNLKSASAPTAAQGGTNPTQVGYGSQVGGIDLMMSRSTFSMTDQTMDLAIDGDGFFQVQDAAGNTFYTRAGMLNFDAAGNLVDMQGNYVLGINGDPTGRAPGSERIQINLPAVNPKAGEVIQTINGQEYTIQASNNTKDSNVSINFTTDSSLPDNTMEATVSTTGIIIKMHPDTVYSDWGTFNAAMNDAIVRANNNREHPGGTFTISYTGSGTDPLAGGLKASDICGTNYGTKYGSAKFTSGNAATVAGGVRPTGSVGSTFGQHWAGGVTEADMGNLGVAFAAGPPDKFTFTMTIAGQTYEGVVDANAGSTGSFQMKNITTNDSGDYFIMQRPDFETLKTNLDTLSGGTYPYNIPADTGLGTGAGQPPRVSASEASREMGLSGTAFALRGGTEGGPQGLADMTGIAIAPNGIIIGLDSQGTEVTIGRIDLATFANQSGLTQSGTSNYMESQNSGRPVLSQPGEGGAGKLVGGTLELSNVDLSREFSDMITTQRGYQANSRIITVSDTMLEELINLKR